MKYVNKYILVTAAMLLLSLLITGILLPLVISTDRMSITMILIVVTMIFIFVGNIFIMIGHWVIEKIENKK